MKLWTLSQKNLEAQSPDKQNKKNQGDLQRSLEPGQKSREGGRQETGSAPLQRQGQEVSLYWGLLQDHQQPLCGDQSGSALHDGPSYSSLSFLRTLVMFQTRSSVMDTAKSLLSRFINIKIVKTFPLTPLLAWLRPLVLS